MKRELIHTLLACLLIFSVVHAQDYVFNNVSIQGTVSGPGAAPVGALRIITTGSCGLGWTEATAFDGKTIIGTIVAHGDVGATGGSDTITPAGTNGTVSFTPSGTNSAATFTGSSASTNSVSAGTPAGTNTAGTISWPIGVPTFTGASGTVPAETFTGSSATSSAVSAGTPAGTNSVPTFTGSALATHQHELPFHSLTSTSISWISSATFGTGTSRAAVSVDGGNVSNTTSAAVAKDQPVSAGTPAGTVTAPTFTGSALGTHTHTLTATGTNGTVSFTPSGTIAWPAGVPTVTADTFSGSALGTHSHTVTATGTNSAATFTGSSGTVPAETWTGNSFDNRSAFIKVIFCVKS